jgi:Glucose / Sorbosone dehydrogenase
VTRAVGKLALATALAFSLWASQAQALSLQTVGTFEKPIFVTSDPGNPERLFVVEREGSVLLVQNGEIRLFGDIGSLVSCCEGEQGLLSIALSPDFDQSGRFFLDYVGNEGSIHVAEMVASGSFAPASSLRNLLTIPHPGETNHYGGQLQFGPEGDLFVSTGDGGGANDELHNAQDPDSLLGKILRITPSGSAEVWSLGLRNPFRFSFDRLTGEIWIGDVGQGAREEVDRGLAPPLGAGANYGWNCMEGFAPGPATDEGCGTPPPGGFVDPVFDYPHTEPEDGSAHGCAIIGGYLARGPGLGDLSGRYLYADHCVGQLRSFAPAAPFASDRSEGLTVDELDSFGEDACGRLYVVSENGPVYRLAGPGAAVCSVTAPPVLSPSFVGIRALSRRVKRHRRALVTVFVSPCNGRRGEPVSLWRGRAMLGTRHLDKVCSARFRPRISRRSDFRATVKADTSYVAAISRKLTVKPRRRVPRHR